MTTGTGSAGDGDGGTPRPGPLEGRQLVEPRVARGTLGRDSRIMMGGRGRL
jgi:hypothetical protein